MTQNALYHITDFLHGLRQHTDQPSSVVADGEAVAGNDSTAAVHRLEVDAHVRSGDYFQTLATALDDLSSRLESNHVVKRSEIDRIVNELLYIDHHYLLTRK